MKYFDLIKTSHKRIDARKITQMELFDDPITEGLKIINFECSRHNLLLEYILKGCINLKEILIWIAKSDDINYDFDPINPEVIELSKLTNLTIYRS